jgi:hypothetical protein
VVFNGQAHHCLFVQKISTDELQAFSSGPAGLAATKNGAVWELQASISETLSLQIPSTAYFLKQTQWPRVEWLTHHAAVGSDGIDALLYPSKPASQPIRGLVVAGTGAGTFKPVKSETMQAHEMHAEWIDIDINTIQKIADQKELIIAVGTTSLRTLESLFWLGVKSLLNPDIELLDIQQWDAYEVQANEISKNVALNALINWMNKKGLTRIFTTTQLLITPGYSFKIVKAMVTNFHQPKSTLLLLVAAAIGQKWETCYEFALENDFRFLSYGDANLLFMAES